jgi:ADP-ribose pyrophosphatase
MNKIISEETKFDGRRLKVVEKIYESEDGSKYSRECVIPGDSVFIIPVTENNEVVFVRQYREVINKIELELPAGRIDPGEEPIESAKRELEEETGIVAGTLEPIMSVYPSCGYTNEKIHIFFAKDFSKGEVHLDETEVILDVEKIPIEKCVELAKENYFDEAITNLAILMYYFKYMKN